MNHRHCPECGVDWPMTLVWAAIILAVILFWIAAIGYAVRAFAADPPRCIESAVVPNGPTSGIGSAIKCSG